MSKCWIFVAPQYPTLPVPSGPYNGGWVVGQKHLLLWFAQQVGFVCGGKGGVRNPTPTHIKHALLQHEPTI